MRGGQMGSGSSRAPASLSGLEKAQGPAFALLWTQHSDRTLVRSGPYKTLRNGSQATALETGCGAPWRSVPDARPANRGAGAPRWPQCGPGAPRESPRPVSPAPVFRAREPLSPSSCSSFCLPGAWITDVTPPDSGVTPHDPRRPRPCRSVSARVSVSLLGEEPGLGSPGRLWFPRVRGVPCGLSGIDF